MRRIAWITLRHEPPYRSGAFATGLEKLGYALRMQSPQSGEVSPGDVVVTWNLSHRYQAAAAEAKVAGAALIVAENGYITQRGNADPVYALARDGHNGPGFWFIGATDRWTPLGHKLASWRPDLEGGYVLIANQRGIGSVTMRSPAQLVDLLKPKIQKHLRHVLGDKNPYIVVREHPGRHHPDVSLAEHLRGARAVVSWSSNVLNVATLFGIPSFRTAPYHVNEAVFEDLSLIGRAPEPDREAAFHKLAWAQWLLPEIANGSAFRCLLQDLG